MCVFIYACLCVFLPEFEHCRVCMSVYLGMSLYASLNSLMICSNPAGCRIYTCQLASQSPLNCHLETKRLPAAKLSFPLHPLSCLGFKDLQHCGCCPNINAVALGMFFSSPFRSIKTSTSTLTFSK